MPFYGISENGANIQLDQYGYSVNACIHCRAVDSTGIKAEGEGEWNARKAPSQVLRRNTLPGNGWA